MNGARQLEAPDTCRVPALRTRVHVFIAILAGMAPLVAFAVHVMRVVAQEDEGDKLQLEMASLDIRPDRVSPGESITITSRIRNPSNVSITAFITPVVSDVPFTLSEVENLDLEYTLAPGEVLNFRVAIKIADAGAFKVGIGGVGPDGFVEPVTAVVVVESGTERWWFVAALMAVFCFAAIPAGTVFRATRRRSGRRADAVMFALGSAGAAIVLMILVDAFYEWVHVGTPGVDAVLALLLIGVMCGFLSLISLDRHLGVGAAAVAAIWLGGFSLWADFEIGIWQIGIGAIAGLALWRSARPLETRVQSAGVVAAAGMWTVAAAPIVQAVVLRSLYGSDFFIL